MYCTRAGALSGVNQVMVWDVAGSADQVRIICYGLATSPASATGDRNQQKTADNNKTRQIVLFLAAGKILWV